MKNLRTISATIFLLILSSNLILGQDIEEKKEKKVTIIPMPVIAANPTTGFIFGVAPGFNWVNGDKETTSMSSVLAGFLYTTKRQLFTSVRGSIFLKDDSWMLLTDVRFNLNSQPTYGLGTDPRFSNQVIDGDYPPVSDDLADGPPENEMMYFNHFRFYQTALKKHADTRFFYGLGYHLDVMNNIEDKLLDLEADPPRLTYHYKYQTELGMPLTAYTQSGISLNTSFDSRDNVANPYDGRLAFASLRLNPDFLGSTESSSQLWLEYRDYFNLSKTRPRNLIAFWAFGWFVTGGKVPYMFLPATGWDMFGRSSRPHTMGRFRGEDLVYTEVEWRFPLQKNKDRLGAVLFVNSTTASSRTEQVSLFNYFQAGYGGGIRYMISPKNRVNISLDYGRGVNGASAIFLNLNEMF
ncbi:BamA/TamA family outer membrane protein [Cognataquiflexum aquatile]|uniref:BamA/TamA family outer membrane protein n=1 Tax=Cognataquiflexum aquatile TaxID=2249427 RepID=UPI000DE84FF2|nr:BamA/TamA family outer membrane protein [Cognataquiflexum aquatile]